MLSRTCDEYPLQLCLSSLMKSTAQARIETSLTLSHSNGVRETKSGLALSAVIKDGATMVTMRWRWAAI